MNQIVAIIKKIMQDNRLLLEGNSRQAKNIQRHKDAVQYYKDNEVNISSFC